MKSKLILNRAGTYHGFLGNNLFAVAATIGIARKNGLEPVFADTGYYDKNFYSWFKGKFNLMSVEELAKIETIELPEPHFHYHDFQLDPTKNYNLTGYFQSARYWEHCEDEIREMFEFSEQVKTVTDNIWRGEINAKEEKGTFFTFWSAFNYPTVSIHVRRGDYLKHPNEHSVLPIGYYFQAVQKLHTPETIYLVFSDDPKWCKATFIDPIFKDRIYFIEGNTPVEDLYLMSLCSHNIICASSFSWWASYLNKNPNKKVIAPKKENWFGPARKTWNVTDLYRNEFIEI